MASKKWGPPTQTFLFPFYVRVPSPKDTRSRVEGLEQSKIENEMKKKSFLWCVCATLQVP